jgi:hypothetical protein
MVMFVGQMIVQQGGFVQGGGQPSAGGVTVITNVQELLLPAQS